MNYFGYVSSICILFGLIQVLTGASLEDKYEPMVAFICDRPAMHRGVSGWISDKSQDCPDTLEDVLSYCKKVYPDHNITNVVESSRFYNISNWPVDNTEREHTHHVRPFRCLVGGFQSDALLVPQHCEFDHRHDITQCKEFSHWNRVADDACVDKGMHLESFGMLLYCNTLGHFNGVEYVCCPHKSSTRVQTEPKDSDDKPHSWDSDEEDSEEDEYDSDEDEDDEYDYYSTSTSSSSSSNSEEFPEENVVDLYEAYLRGQPFPSKYNNEHKKFLAAKERMKMNQKKKVAKLLQEWEEAREHVNVVRKTDPKTADRMNDEIAQRFKHLYASFKLEDASENKQLAALHQQHIQAMLNERKREAMDRYMNALENGNVAMVKKYLHSYIKAEEKDRMHTVNHFEHIRNSNAKEALRIHRHIINHLKLSEMRIDQAMEMLTHYPSIEFEVRPEIENFLKRFNEIASSIKNVVLPVPEVDSQEESSSSSDESSDDGYTTSNDISYDNDNDRYDSQVESEEKTQDADEYPTPNSSSESDSAIIDDEVQEDEHSYERADSQFVANAQRNMHSIENGGLKSATASASGTQMGSTIGIALGSVSVFVIVIVAVMMVRHNRHRQPVSHGYVEVDPSASPEDRHLANMQMNGYENPTYKYFEVQNNPKA